MTAGRYSVVMWSDVALLTGGWAVCGFLLLAIANHWIALAGMADDIAIQRNELIQKHQAPNGRASEILLILKDQIFWQRTALLATGAASLVIAVFITYVVANHV